MSAPTCFGYASVQPQEMKREIKIEIERKRDIEGLGVDVRRINRDRHTFIRLKYI